MTKMKLARELGPDFLPRALGREAAEALHAELGQAVDALRGDVQEYNTATDRARLARYLVRRADAALLQARSSEAAADLEEAAVLFRVDGREAPLMLIDARQAWAAILDGEAARAKSMLQNLLALRDDVTIRGWEDQLCLWLAAAHLACNEAEDARAVLLRAAGVLESHPQRSRTLVVAALDRLGVAHAL